MLVLQYSVQSFFWREREKETSGRMLRKTKETGGKKGVSPKNHVFPQVLVYCNRKLWREERAQEYVKEEPVFSQKTPTAVMMSQ